MKNFAQKFAVLFVVALVSACSTLPPILPPIKPGAWTMRTPDNRSIPVTVTKFSDVEYHIRAQNMLFNGVYVLDSVYQPSHLRCVKPDNPRMGDYAFSWRSTTELVLSGEPPFEHTQKHLISATMTTP